MATAKDVYTAFKSFKNRQQSILNSIMAEQREIQDEFEKTSEKFETLLNKLFPNIEDLPLDAMNSTSERVEGHQTNYAEMIDRLQKQDAKNRHTKKDIVSKYGTAAEIKNNLRKSEVNSDLIRSQINELDQNKRKMEKELFSIKEKMLPIEDASQTLRKTITTDNSKEYEQFNLLKWAFDSEWRKIHSAVSEYRNKGGRDIDSDRNGQEKTTTSIAELNNQSQGLHKKFEIVERNKKDLTEMNDTIQDLDNKFMGKKNIYKAVCSNFANLLIHEEATKFFAKNIPEDKANQIVIETIKFQKLGDTYDNLEKLRIQAEKALGKISDPISKLERLSRNYPSKSIDLDPDKISQQLEGFNTVAEQYISVSNNTRQSLRKLSDTGNKSHYHTSSSVTAANSSDPFLMNMWLFYTLMNDNNNSHNQSIPDLGIPTTNIDSSIPDVGTSFDSASIASFEIPSIPDTSNFDFGSSSSYDSGSSSSYDSGSSGGGGSFITSDINADPIIKGIHHHCDPR